MNELFAGFMRIAWPLRLALLALVSLGIGYGYFIVAPTAAVTFIAVAALSVCFGFARVQVSLPFTFGFYAMNSEDLNFETETENSDRLAAHIFSHPPHAAWAIAGSALLTATVVAMTTLAPIGVGWNILAGLIAWIAMQGTRSKLTKTEWIEDQRRRDDWAMRTYERLVAHKRVPPFLLYLRPFAVTGAVRTYDQTSLELAKRGMHPTEGRGKNNPNASYYSKPLFSSPTINFIGGNQSNEQDNPDFEALLESAARDARFKVIALGRPGEALGTGRILLKTDQEWQDAVQLLGDHAIGFILLPSLNEGTRWEMQWLRDSRNFRNCIFIMPGQQPGFDGASYWTRVRDGLSETMKLPRFNGAPTLYCYGPDGAAHLVVLAAEAVIRFGAPVFYASRTQLKHALEVLVPISNGHEPAYLRDVVAAASAAAQHGWSVGEHWRQVDMHPARRQCIRVGDKAPLLPKNPTSVWWGREAIDVEFTPGVPLERTLVLVRSRVVQGRAQIAGIHYLFGDADPHFLQPAPV